MLLNGATISVVFRFKGGSFRLENISRRGKDESNASRVRAVNGVEMKPAAGLGVCQLLQEYVPYKCAYPH